MNMIDLCILISRMTVVVDSLATAHEVCCPIFFTCVVQKLRPDDVTTTTVQESKATTFVAFQPLLAPPLLINYSCSALNFCTHPLSN